MLAVFLSRCLSAAGSFFRLVTESSSRGLSGGVLYAAVCFVGIAVVEQL